MHYHRSIPWVILKCFLRKGLWIQENKWTLIGDYYNSGGKSQNQINAQCIRTLNSATLKIQTCTEVRSWNSTCILTYKTENCRNSFWRCEVYVESHSQVVEYWGFGLMASRANNPRSLYLRTWETKTVWWPGNETKSTLTHCTLNSSNLII